MPTIVDDGVGAELRLEEVMEHPGTTGHPLATHLACILSPSAAALEDHYCDDYRHPHIAFHHQHHLSRHTWRFTVFLV